MIFIRYYKYQDSFHDFNAKLGINWYFHHKKHNHKCFTIEILIPYGVLDIDIAYKNVAEYRKFRDKL